MIADGPALYRGAVRHRRFAPRPHAFTYRLFLTLLDIDRIDDAMSAAWFTSRNRANFVSFYDRDHLDGPEGATIRQRLELAADAAGIRLPDGPVYLLTHPRYLGYVFNPISLFYCFNREGSVALVLAEVNNTYGGRHLYWLPQTGDRAGRIRATVPKAMYVSPFMERDVDYQFAITPPGESLVVHMDVSRRAGASHTPIFDATLTLRRRPWTAGALARALVRFPWMTATVIGAIHWEALRLRMKGLAEMPFFEEPAR